ncbi:MAG: hypothetical protein WC178_03565 [Candidatus Paceibacterota bacterium]
MEQDFTKTWEELSGEEKAAWEETCKNKAVKSRKTYCKRFGYIFSADIVTWNAESEWNGQYSKAKWAAYVESNLTPEQKELLAAKELEKKLKAELKAARKELATILD